MLRSIRARRRMRPSAGSQGSCELDRPPIDLAAARQARGLADSAFAVLAIGETRRYARRTTTRRRS